MKRKLFIGFVCILTAAAVVLNGQAQEKKKEKEDHAHEEGKGHKDGHKHDKDGHKHQDDKGHEHEDSKGHAHPVEPPHGGTVVKLGKHGFNLEFVRDPDAGKFQVFILDGHMEYAAVPEKSFALHAKVQGKEQRLTLNRVPDHGGAALPEKSSLFEGSADWIKSAKKFEGLIPEITLKGKSYTNISFVFPKGEKHKH